MENLYSIGIQIPRQRQITILGELRLALRRGMSMSHYARRRVETRQLSKNVRLKARRQPDLKISHEEKRS